MRTKISTNNDTCWVVSTTCIVGQCNLTRWDTTQSTSFQQTSAFGSVKYTDENETVGTVIGKYATDKICINNNETCSDNQFRFLKVESAASMLQIGFEAFCGFLPKQFGVDTQNQLIPYLKQTNAIDNLRFTIYVRDSGSKMTIGTPDDFSRFVFSPLVTDPEQWQVDIVTISAGEPY